MTHFLAGKRAKEMVDVAKRQGFEYRDTDRSAERSFTLFQQATGRNAPENVLLGSMRGHSFTAFDFTYLEDLDAKRQQQRDTPWVPYESPAQFTCVIVGLNAGVPRTILNPRSRKRLFATDVELEVESKELGSLFQVWSGLPNMARWLGDARFLDFLSNTRGKFAFELGEHGLLVIASDVRAQDLLGLIAMGIACADSLPTGLLKAYQKVSTAPVHTPEEGDDEGGQVTDLREARMARAQLKAGRRSATVGTTGPRPATPAPAPATAAPAAAAPTTSRSNTIVSLPRPPAPEVWEQWVAAHAEEVASWDSAEALPDWGQMSADERAAELAELSTLAEEGLITADELAEAQRYLQA